MQIWFHINHIPLTQTVNFLKFCQIESLKITYNSRDANGAVQGGVFAPPWNFDIINLFISKNLLTKN